VREITNAPTRFLPGRMLYNIRQRDACISSPHKKAPP
jgi:hypothetical protein